MELEQICRENERQCCVGVLAFVAAENNSHFEKEICQNAWKMLAT